MKYLSYTRDPDAVFATFIEQDDGTFIAGKPLNIVLPRRHLDRGMAFDGDTFRTIGIFMMATEGKWSLFSVCAFVELMPDSISQFTYQGVEYVELSFDVGSRIFKSIDTVQAGINVYLIYKEYISNGNMPFYIELDNERDDASGLLDTALSHAGTSIGSQRLETELIVSLSARNPEDLTEYFRQLPDEVQAKTKPNFIGLKSAAYSATNTLQRLAGAHAGDQGIVAAIVHPTERVTEQEILVRGL